MSKEVVVFDIETVEKIRGALFLLSSLALANRLPQLDEIDDLRRIVKAKFFEAKQGKRRFSVLKWHPVTERPEKDKVLIKLKNGTIVTDFVIFYELSDEEKKEGRNDWNFSVHYKCDTKEWTYLPE